MTVSMTTFSLTTLRIKGLFVTIGINDPENKDIQHNNTHNKGLIVTLGINST
jgi:hypothetical protein